MGWKFAQVHDKQLRDLIDACQGGKVFPVQTLLDAGVVPQLVEALAETHAEQSGRRTYKGIPARRLQGTALEPHPLMASFEYEGVYDCDLLLAIAGDFGIAIALPYGTATENAEHLKILLKQEIWGA